MSKDEEGVARWLPIVLTAISLGVGALTAFTSTQVGQVADQVKMIDGRLGRVESILMDRGRR